MTVKASGTELIEQGHRPLAAGRNALERATNWSPPASSAASTTTRSAAATATTPLRGDFGDDTISGNAGDDLLDGVPGMDTLEGGPGAGRSCEDFADTFITDPKDSNGLDCQPG